VAENTIRRSPVSFAGVAAATAMPNGMMSNRRGISVHILKCWTGCGFG
jgi:hypothetical protein